MEIGECKNGEKAKQNYFRGQTNNGMEFGLRENKVSIIAGLTINVDLFFKKW